MPEIKALVNVDSWWDGLVHDRFQSVLELVLDAITDDYGTVEIIMKTINEWDTGNDPGSWAARGAVPVSRPEVVRALQELIREGYAQACVFLGSEARVVDFHGRPPADVWFYATSKGIEAVRRYLGSE
jgi:hypothetical protein